MLLHKISCKLSHLVFRWLVPASAAFSATTTHTSASASASLRSAHFDGFMLFDLQN